MVVNQDESIDRKAYTFCVLEQLVEGLCRRDLFVIPSERWSNPSAKLLRGNVIATGRVTRNFIIRNSTLDWVYG